MKRFNTFAVASLVFVITVMSSGVAGAATLNVIDGILHGAYGVDVGGALYDVEFVDGTCVDLFNGCDGASDFMFTTEAAALMASQALLDQVLINSEHGLFDDLPQLTHGCTGGAGAPCLILTPYAPWLGGDPFVWEVEVANIASSLSSPEADPNPANAYWYSEISPGSNPPIWASWEAHVVPEPSTALLLGLGLAGMAAARRRVS